MPLVKALNNHPHGSRIYTTGDIYDADENDVKILESLKRVVRVADNARPTYQTRDMQAAIIGTRQSIPMQSPMPDQVDQAAADANGTPNPKTETIPIIEAPRRGRPPKAEADKKPE